MLQQQQQQMIQQHIAMPVADMQTFERRLAANVVKFFIIVFLLLLIHITYHEIGKKEASVKGIKKAPQSGSEMLIM